LIILLRGYYQYRLVFSERFSAVIPNGVSGSFGFSPGSILHAMNVVNPIVLRMSDTIGRLAPTTEDQHALHQEKGVHQIVIETTVGDFVAQLHPDKAPLTTGYFLNLVDIGHYQGGDIYRATHLGEEDGPYLLQGGAALPFLQDSEAHSRAPMLDKTETTGITGIQHRRGTLSLARDLNKTGHALAEFFICLYSKSRCLHRRSKLRAYRRMNSLYRGCEIHANWC
jgi:cyclophilin family peptidyl-prolyl cis-trans isomerase